MNSHNQPMPLPPPVQELIARAFPGQALGDLAATFGGFSHLTVGATIGERHCILKAATTPAKRADLRREADMLARLADAALPIAALLALTEDQNWTVEVLGALPGANGLSILAHTPTELPQLAHELGKLLAIVHHTPVAPSHPDQMLATRARQTAASLPAPALAPALAERLASSLVHPAWQPPTARLVHGDAGLHNILWQRGITGLLDWEWAGWGNPMLDLAWVRWTMRWRQLPIELWHSVVAGYRSVARLDLADPGTLHALILGQIAIILVRTSDQPPAFEEWCRRAHWTVAQDFS